MHTRHILFTTFLLASLAKSQVISVNFEGLDNANGGADYPNLLAPTDTAGFIPVTNWNNASGATGTAVDLLDDSGAATTADITWTGQAMWSWERSGDVVPGNGDGTMFNGYLDTTGNDGSHTISVTDVPYSAYEVVVYIDGEHTGANRPMRVNVNPGGTGDNPALDVYNAEGANWNGTYVQAIDTIAPGTIGANYARFTGLNTANFDIYVEAENFRAGINGFQIIETSDADNDGLPSAWEIANGLDDNDDGSTDPNNGPAGDPDNDGSDNLEELQRLTDPQDDDSDDDTLLDGVETGDGNFVDATATGTNPLSDDTDGDTLTDGDEVTGAIPSNPLLADSDNDGLRDPLELTLGTDPIMDDSDSDSFNDTLEVALGSDPNNNTSSPNLNLQSININFEGLDNPNGGTDSPNLLAPTDSAGLFGAANWNNVTGAVATANNLLDGNGTATSANLDLIGMALWSWERSADNVPANPNGTLFNGYLDTIDNDGTHIINLTGIPYSNYDVIVYVDGENNTGNTRPGSVSLDVTGEEFYFDDTQNWAGVFSQGLGTDLATATPGANFVVFNDVTGADISLVATARNFRAGVNGIQIIGTPGTRLQITDIDYDPTTNQATLTWNSINGVEYSIQKSSTLNADWIEVGDFSATGATSTFTVPSAEIPNGTQRLFFRVVVID